jgi:outer membrane receptor protein involved in Fe transport
MKTQLIGGASALVLGCLIAAPALAQATDAAPAPAQPTSPTDHQVEAVVVTATRTPSPLSDVPASVSVISTETIQNTPARLLDDVLRTAPGIDLLGYGAETQHPTSNSLGMRGLGGGAQGISRALVMVDGVPINDPFFGYVQWSRAPIDDISRVEVVRGGGSPLWGNYAEGGVINVISRTPTQDELGLNAGGGSYGAYRASVSAAGGLGSGNMVQGFVQADGESGYQAVPAYERAPFNVPTSFDAITARVKDTADLGDGTKAALTVDFHDNRQQLQTVLDSNSQQIVNVSGSLSKALARDGTLALTAFYGDSRFRTNNSTYFPDQFDLAATTQALNEIHHVDAQDTGGSLIWSQQVPSVLTNYMVGVDWHYITGADHTQHFVAPDFSPTDVFTRSTGNQLFLGAFAQATLSPVPNLTIIASGRLQNLHNGNGFDGSVGGVGAVPNRDFTTFDPRVNVRYALPGGFALRGAYYQSFRAPNIGDQLYTYAAGGFVQLPSPLLKPEKLDGGEVGLDFTRPGLRSQFTVYRTTIDNYIVAEATTNPVYSPNGWYVVQNQNIASVLAQGFEAEVEWDIGAGFSADFGYTYADSTVQKNPLDPMSIGQQIIDVPRNTGSVGLTYQAKQGWRMSVQGRYVDRTAWASPDHTDPGYPGRISADPHFVTDLSGSYPVTRKLDLYVQVQNLFDRRYVVTSYSAPSPQAYGTPFRVFAGVRFKL